MNLVGSPNAYGFTPEERFWAKVDRTGDCWVWMGSLTPQGYGQAWSGGCIRRATHVAWELTHGQSFPEGVQANHHCDNPPCVRPAHLFLGTQSDNIRDAYAKGRKVVGGAAIPKTKVLSG